MVEEIHSETAHTGNAVRQVELTGRLEGLHSFSAREVCGDAPAVLGSEAFLPDALPDTLEPALWWDAHGEVHIGSAPLRGLG